MAESNVQINAGTGGAQIRTEQLVPQGSTTQVQQQVISVADAAFSTLQRVNMSGEALIDGGHVLGLILDELRFIRLSLEHLGGFSVVDQVPEEE